MTKTEIDPRSRLYRTAYFFTPEEKRPKEVWRCWLRVRVGVMFLGACLLLGYVVACGMWAFDYPVAAAIASAIIAAVVLFEPVFLLVAYGCYKAHSLFERWRDRHCIRLTVTN